MTQKPRESYKTRYIRMSDITWARLKKLKKKSGKTWNLFILEDLILRNGKTKKRDKSITEKK
jgi:hypothetical protein